MTPAALLDVDVEHFYVLKSGFDPVFAGDDPGSAGWQRCCRGGSVAERSRYREGGSGGLEVMIDDGLCGVHLVIIGGSCGIMGPCLWEHRWVG
eukprot:7584922-Prorocentrum_lima.AAC.1